MPILLKSDQSIRLDDLLFSANTEGIECQIQSPPFRALPKIRGLASLAEALKEDVSFLSNLKYRKYLSATKAGAVIVPKKIAKDLSIQNPPPEYSWIACDQPYLLYARLAQWFHNISSFKESANIHPSSIIDPTANIDPGVYIAPQCIIGPGAKIGKGCILNSACIIGEDSQLGTDCYLYPRVTLYKGVTTGSRVIMHSGVILGSDGFGYVSNPNFLDHETFWEKIPHFGSVSIGSDVEIGANTTIDRGSLENTIIDNGVKLDNQIMIGHNVRVGKHTAIAACVGIAGSTVIGAYCTIAGAAMISGHLILVDNVHISGGTAVISNILKPGRYTGVYPGSEHFSWKNNTSVLLKLSQLNRRLRVLEKNK